MGINLEDKIRRFELIDRVSIVDSLDLVVPPEVDFFGYVKGELRFYKGDIPKGLNGGRRYYSLNGYKAIRFEGFARHEHAGHIDYGEVFGILSDGDKVKLEDND